MGSRLLQTSYTTNESILFCTSQWRTYILFNKKWGTLGEFKCIQLMNMLSYYLSSTCVLKYKVITGDKNMSHFIVMVDFINDLHLGLIENLCWSQRLWAVRSISTSLQKGFCWNLNRYIVSRWEIVSCHRRRWMDVIRKVLLVNIINDLSDNRVVIVTF